MERWTPWANVALLLKITVVISDQLSSTVIKNLVGDCDLATN
jgi:hypothetical protein